MDTIIDRFLLLTEALIKHAKKDLMSQDDHVVLQSAKYFFLRPAKGDDGDLKKFAGLCLATGIDDTAAAEAIFKELPSSRQKRIRKLLHNAVYHVQSGSIR